jgi:tellurium resistance protein TerZ
MPISLQKGQRISLSKEGGAGLRGIVMGLGWDMKKPSGVLGFLRAPQAIDLDASCLMFDGTKNLVDVVYFGKLQSNDRSIQHTGDNRTGAGDGDDEQIIVDLTRVSANVTSLIFVVNSFTGQNFSQIENAVCRVVDQSNNSELARYDLSCTGNHTAMVMTKVYRHGGEWKLHAIGEIASGRTFVELAPAVVPHI